MKKLFVWLTLLLLCLALASCGKGEVESEEETLRYDAETTWVNDGTPGGAVVYVEDYPANEVGIAKKYFVWRNEGNPDPEGWEDAIVCENGTDLTLEPTSKVYSLSSDVENWLVSVTDVSDDVVMGVWCNQLNLEKYEDGEWIRLGIINVSRLAGYTAGQAIRVEKNGSPIINDIYIPLTSEMWEEGLILLSPFGVSVDKICPAPTPGQYRFVFYYTVENGENPGARICYIPFEVVE